MNEHDVIRKMKRFPDKILHKEDMSEEEWENLKWKSCKWKCSQCGKLYEYDEPHTIPSPCEYCESIFFEKLT